MEKVTMKIKTSVSKNDETTGDKAYVYSFCENKLNGKAITGHKGSHLQKTKRQRDPQMKLKISNSNLNIHEQKVKYNVCNQKFGSDRSLYGHTKNYTDKNWRGMKPPTPPVKNDDLVHQNHKNLSANLPLLKWSKIGRRTPRKTLRKVSVSNNGANDLLALENGEHGKENLPPKKRRLRLTNPSNAGNITGSLLNKIQEGSYHLQSGRQISNESSANTNKLGDPKTEKDGIGLCKNQIGFQKQYLCGICQRSFKSYQALGGHKAHHNIRVDKLMTADEFSDTDSDLMATYVEEHDEQFMIVHKCPLCGKIYSNGQAFGGHKRHCKGPIPHSEVLRFEGVREIRNQRSGVLKLDLNELPPECIIEEIEDATEDH